ncbi:MAG TPA: CCA tRNA nucleotidyltransferase, partial [Thermoclostridium sp.]|nr:CCA tRNA nucleotidyltransferase [Thermoclostridium sp.]
MLFEIPNNILRIIDILENNGHKAYIVGGCIRDMLLNIKPKDYDICTSARPEQVQKLFKKSIPTGIKHGTVTVISDSNPVEVTTFRVESGYSDRRHPDNVNYTDSLIEDLKRRDFTMNAIAYHPVQGIIDPFDGASDIKRRIIKTVGDPKERFNEDALRMLRAIRFQARFNFSIEQNTLNAIEALSKNIKDVSRERILLELNGIM